GIATVQPDAPQDDVVKPVKTKAEQKTSKPEAKVPAPVEDGSQKSLIAEPEAKDKSDASSTVSHSKTA
ncbi:MAG TPA: ribonuclease III, partial [Oxalicibacterium sp.]